MFEVFVKSLVLWTQSTETSSFYYLNIIKKLRVSQAFDGDSGPSSRCDAPECRGLKGGIRGWKEMRSEDARSSLV